MTSSSAPPTLSLPEYKRYGRQMIIDGFGLEGQQLLKAASIIVVGAGGLGCPAIQYLAGAGVGRIGVVDHDIVESSNLSRQVLHNEQTVGLLKAESAKLFVHNLNPHITVTTYTDYLLPSNALSILEPYDIILDCTDNLPTRYLLSDAAVILGKPLVSGAAMKLEGQMSVWNLNPRFKASASSSKNQGTRPQELPSNPAAKDAKEAKEIREPGPCYRCIFPKPPAGPPGGGSCEEVGILGVVTGIIGTLQSAEAIKIILRKNDPRPTLLLYSFFSSPTFRSIKLRGRKPNCVACGTPDEETNPNPESVDSSAPPSAAPRLSKLDPSNTDYVQFCGGPVPDWETEGLVSGTEGTRITPKELKRALDGNFEKNHSISTEAATVSRRPMIIDVRPRTEFGICSLKDSTNIPITELLANPASALTSLTSLEDPEATPAPMRDQGELFVVCRLGNDSQLAAEALRNALEKEGEDKENTRDMRVRDLVGGLRLWAKDVDREFPVY